MQYEGYTARVAFDERDAIFVGRILNVQAIVSFHGHTAGEVRSEFERAIDEFLQDTKKPAGQ